MKAYHNERDEILIERLREGESEITDFLMNKYKNMVRKKAASMYILGADREDLIQEGMIGLFKALSDYDMGRDASFKTFADLCVARQMYSAIENSKRQKNIPLNTYISLYVRMHPEEEGSEETLETTLVAGAQLTPEEEIIDREEAARIEGLIEHELSDFERRAMDLHLTGMTSTQIARVLGRDAKATDNALTRAKGKLRKLLANTENAAGRKQGGRRKHAGRTAKTGKLQTG